MTDFQRETCFVLGIGVLLVGASLALHAFFVFVILRTQVWLEKGWLARSRGMALVVPSVLAATIFIAASGFIQVFVWAVVLWRLGHFGSLIDAFYFSGTTYTTLGNGVHALAAPYRALEPMEAMTGILASGINTAVLFAMLARMGRRHGGFADFFE